MVSHEVYHTVTVTVTDNLLPHELQKSHGGQPRGMDFVANKVEVWHKVDPTELARPGRRLRDFVANKVAIGSHRISFVSVTCG